MPDRARSCSACPGRRATATMAVKVVTVFESHDVPSHLATIGLYDAETGACRAFIDGTYITAMRTSAAAAVATDLLARDDARTLAIIGAGVQGEHHLLTFPLVRDFDEIRIALAVPRGRRARSRRPHPRARATTTPRRPSRGADVVALATHAAQPVIEPAWIAPGTHVSSVGYHPPDGELPRELTGRALRRDPRSRSSRRRSAARSSPASTRATATELGEVLLGTRPGRTDARRDHDLQGDGPRDRGHRGRRARRRRGATNRHGTTRTLVAPEGWQSGRMRWS